VNLWTRPLYDRLGRFSPLKATVFILLFVPGLWFLALAMTDGLTPQPFGFIIYNSGVWAMWLLLLSLAVTPARHILRWPELIAVRRMTGLAGLGYTLFHVVIYFTLDRTSWATISADLKRLTIILAIASTLGLLALAVTSFDAAIRRLGSRNWNRIHNLAYPAIGLAVLHFDMGPESLGGTPFVITGLYFWAMGWRGLNRVGRGTDAVWLLGLALAATAFSFAFEATWIRYYRGFTEFGTAEELWNAGLGLAATWQVLIVTLSVAALAGVFADSRVAARLTRRPALARALPAV
jgi:sulfoxide reductase heme-binding subunit YedZ